MHENIMNIAPEEFMRTVDLHFHTTHSDGKNTPEEMLEAYKEKGFKKVAITDHNVLTAHKKLQIPDGIEVIRGIEFDCWDGYVFMHILGYNIDIDNPKLNKLCAKNHFAATNDVIRFINHRSAKKVIKTIKEAGGIAVLAHPACCWSRDIKKTIKKLVSYGLDGIETHYYYRRHRAYTKFYEPEYIKEIGEELGILQTGGSDSHTVEAIIKLD